MISHRDTVGDLEKPDFILSASEGKTEPIGEGKKRHERKKEKDTERIFLLSSRVLAAALIYVRVLFLMSP